MGILNIDATSLALTRVCTFYATKLSAKNFWKSQTRTDVSVQLPSQFQSFIIYLYLSVCVFPVLSIHYSYLLQVSVNQGHQCLPTLKINMD